jgi:hypothetical protein
LRVSIACGEWLELTWIKSCKSLQLREGTATPCPVHRHPYGGAHLDLAEKGRERLVWGGHRTCRCTPPWARRCTTWSPPLGVQCHRRVSLESIKAGLVTVTVTARVTAVHRPIFLYRASFGDLAGLVTATPRAVPPPPLSGDQRSSR